MRITKQEIVPCPLEHVVFLDLSSKKIAVIENLQECKRLHTLVLKNNVIDSIRNIDSCRELWNINLSGNKIKSLHGLSRFLALGSLVLTNNNLDWIELKRLSHIHLLCLSLTCNFKMDIDRNHRYHVIDMLPHLWMLDGQLITAGERKRVKNFFATSAASSHPVRRKVSTHCVFVPTNLQSLSVTGVFGEKTTQLMAQFPMKYTHNIDLDKKRLKYLAYILEDDLGIENDYKLQKGECTISIPPLQKLIIQRSIETEQCNMLLLLLVTYLEFKLPYDLMIATLETAKISTIGDFHSHDLFVLPDHVMLKVVSLLLSGAAIDRDEHKEGGLYSELYRGLHLLVYSLQKTSSTARRPCDAKSTPSYNVTLPLSDHQHYRCLIASEVVHLMCLVPIFFDFLQNNKGVLEMIAVATNNRNISDNISHIARKIQNFGGDVWDMYHEIASYLLQSTTVNIFTNKAISCTSHKSLRRVSSQIIQTSKWFSSPFDQRTHSAGAVAMNHKCPLQPELGDLVMCASEGVARIVALSEARLAVLQLNSEISGLPDSYFYIDPNGLVWDSLSRYWTCDNLLANVELHPSYESKSTLISRRDPNFTISSKVGPTRPHSQISYTSENMLIIPSVEELIDDSEIPTKSDVGLSLRPKSAEQIEEAKFHHQQHVLQQYMLNKPMQLSMNEVTKHSSKDPCVHDLIVPTPKVTLPHTWNSLKSVPMESSFPPRKPHSCFAVYSNADLSKPPSSSNTSFMVSEERKPIVLHAWSPVNVAKQTKVSTCLANQGRSHSSYFQSRTPHSATTSSKRKEHIHISSSNKKKGTRKLGDVLGLSVLGTSAW